MARLKSEQEFYQDLMTQAGRGLDMRDGSAFSLLFHAIAQQAATMERNMRLTKLMNHPVWCDADSLQLMGERLGMYQFAATPTIFRIQTGRDVVLNEGDTVTATDTKQSYQVTGVELGEGENHYELSSQETGSKTSAIPYAWFTEFKFAKSYSQPVPFAGRITEKLADGRDEESPDMFRDRVLGAYMARPFNSNAQSYREIIMRRCEGVGGVRIDIPTYLTYYARAVVDIYLGDRDLKPVTNYTLKLAKKVVEETEVIGMTTNVHPATRLDTPDALKFRVHYTAGGSQLIPDEIKASVVEMMQDELRRLSATTSPTSRISINVPLYKGLIARMLTRFASVDRLVVRYNRVGLPVDYEEEFSLWPAEFPWVTMDMIEYVPNNDLADDLVPGVN